MRVAILGSGAREHALSWALNRHGHDVTVLPGNGGTPKSVPVRADDFAGVLNYCRMDRPDLVLVGPEAPLVNGIVDHLRGAGIAVLGPTRAAARLEGSKIFAKGFMREHGVATAEAWLFGPGDDPHPILERLEGRAVLKFDGLAAGKGVWVCASVEEARHALSALRARHGADARFLVERRLEGDEVSIIGFTDGRDIRLLPPSQDHKPLSDGDRGPNTGGMGAFSPVPQVDAATMERILADIVRPTLAGLQREGLDYRGILYFGVMLTAEGPRLLEYNVRLGDPEATVLLPLLESDVAELALACLEGRVDRAEVRIRKGAAACVVLAARGYPDSPEYGHEIRGLDEVDAGTLLFHAGTRRAAGEIVTSGGRVLDVVSTAEALEDALRQVYVQVRKLGFDGMHYRGDIGRRPWQAARRA